MELIMNLIELGKATFDLLFAVPILGILACAGLFGPMIAKAIRHR